MSHQIKQYNDQYICSKCGKQWDVNDPEPPVCVTTSTSQENSNRWINHIRNILKKDSK